MNQTSEPFSEPESPPPRLHYRRRFFPSLNDSERSNLVENLAKRVSPSLDFFLFALLSGAITGIAYLFDSPSLLIISALLAPIMAPVIGLSLATAIGSLRFFALSLAGTFVGSLLVFIVGVLAGIASLIFPEQEASRLAGFASISWDVLFVLVLGVFLTALSLIKSEQKPVLPSAAVAYVIFAITGGAGYALGAGNFRLALDFSLTLAFYLLVSIVIGAVIFLLYGFRPGRIYGYGLLIVFFAITGMFVYQFKPFYPQMFLNGFVAEPVQISPTFAKATVELIATTPDVRTQKSSLTQSLSKTPLPSSSSMTTLTPTITLTPGPTAEWVAVDVDDQIGARLRENPGFESKVIRIIENGVLVKLLPGVEFKDNLYWANVETIDGTIGWMVHTVFSTSTPSASTIPLQQ